MIFGKLYYLSPFLSTRQSVRAFVVNRWFLSRLLRGDHSHSLFRVLVSHTLRAIISPLFPPLFAECVYSLVWRLLTLALFFFLELCYYFLCTLWGRGTGRCVCDREMIFLWSLFAPHSPKSLRRSSDGSWFWRLSRGSGFDREYCVWEFFVMRICFFFFKF